MRFIMTAFGEDRPGIVADVTRILFENGCNLEENSMTLLADEFTLILLFSSEQDSIEEELQRECRRLERDKGISAFLRPLYGRKMVADSKQRRRSIHVEGMDQAGIVYRVSQSLADIKISIINLNSDVKQSPESGAAIYVMDILVEVPESVSDEAFEDAMVAVADELHVDIAVK